MSDNKITREEMIEWFGSDAPIEAVNLVWNAPGDKTLDQIRTELRAMGEAHRRSRSQPEMIRRVMDAIAPGCFSEHCSETDRHEIEMMARRALEAMRELPDDPGPRYTAGEYSRRTQEAMVADALSAPAPTARYY